MKKPRNGLRRRSIAFAAVSAAVLTVSGLPVGLDASAAQATAVTSVTGGATGYFSSVGLSGGPATDRGPAGTPGCDDTTTSSCSPSVSLPAAGGSDQADDLDGASAQHGPTIAFATTFMTTGTQGRTGDDGQVHAWASASAIGSGPLTATGASSTCSADASGVTASTAIAGGRLVTSTDPTTGEPSVTRRIGPTPAPNTVLTGTLDHLGDSFKVVFNEQILNPDDSITVNAYHQYLLGPGAVGDLIVGQSTCGVTEADAPSAPETVLTAVEGTVPTADQSGKPGAWKVSPALQAGPSKAAVPSAAVLSAAVPSAAVPDGPALVAAAAAPMVIPAGTEGAGAYGFYASLGLFGGPPVPTGPTPKVALPAGGADPALTETVPTGKAQYGPAVLFESGEIKVSTQGTATTSTSSASAADVGPSPFEASLASSTCSSTGGEVTGSSTITGGTVRVSLGPDEDATETDDVLVPIPANPPPNTTFEGAIENVGDTFTVVVNEQERTETGIVVNAVHVKLPGPNGIGDLVIAQSRCLKTGTAAAPGAGGTGTTTNTRGTTGATGTRSTGGSAMASTGFDRPILPGMLLLALGSALVLWGRSRRRSRPEHQANGDG